MKSAEILRRADEQRIFTQELHYIHYDRRIYINQPHTDPLARSVKRRFHRALGGKDWVIETIGFIGYGISPGLVRLERLQKGNDGRTALDEVIYIDTSGREHPARELRPLDLGARHPAALRGADVGSNSRYAGVSASR